MCVQASNAADILSLAHKYNAQPLKSFALSMISRNVEEVCWIAFSSLKHFLLLKEPFNQDGIAWKWYVRIGLEVLEPFLLLSLQSLKF